MMINEQGLMKRLFMIVAAAGLVFASAQSGIGDWKNFTAMNSVRAVASIHDSVWAATSGGAFLYRLSDSSFVRFTNADGLTTNDLTAIVVDNTGSVWFGQSDGSIDVYTPATARWRYIRDIAVSDKSQKSITSFYASGDSLYIATAFGVSLFSISRFEFIDTYGNFGAVIQPPVLSVARFQNRIYVATVNGIAVSKQAAANLAAPESWDTFTSIDSISTLIVFNGKVLAGGIDGMYAFDGSSWVVVPAAGPRVTFTGQSSSTAYFTRDNYILTYAADGSVQVIGTQIHSQVTSGIVAAGTPVFGTVSLGIAQWNAAASSWNVTAPNGPASNSFVSIAVDKDGAIWGASGREFGTGFYSYSSGRWTNYNTSTMPGLHSNNAYGISISPNNSKWICTWDSGLVLLNSANKLVRIFDSRNPGFGGTPGHPDFIVPAIPAFGADGSVWTSIYNTANLARVVWKMNPDSTWVSFPAPFGSYNQMLAITIDRNGTKWFSNQVPGFQPLAQQCVYLNENLGVAGTADGWGSLSQTEGITSPQISTVVEDRDGILWLGTSVGITTISDPLHPLKTIGTVFLGAVHDQLINCIAVDALNNKWVGTSNGVIVLSPDGTALLDQYTVANSNGKLVDDHINSIAFDTRNGIAYFGTDKGLSSVGIATIGPAADFSGMSVAPNPFRPGDQPYVMIRGLAEGSTIKILTISGKLVKEFAAQGGGRAFWDGTTDSGEFVATGIYLAVAYSENGSQVGTAKLAVIRR
jgi:ligand-binding sensor domain-containing protein